MPKQFTKPAALVFSLIFGLLLSEYTFTLARYSAPCLFAILLISMTRIQKLFEPHYAKPLLGVIFMPLLCGIAFYAVLSFIFPNNAEILTSSALIILSPLATGAVVMIKAIKGNIPFTVMVIVFSHFVTIILWPLFGLASGMEADLTIITPKLVAMVLIPLVLSRIIRKTPLVTHLSALEPINFYLWVFTVFSNISSISHTFKTGEVASKQLGIMATIALALLAMNYIVGVITSKRTKFKAETLQLFIQRNTIFGIWIANAFFSPIYAICPIFYLIFQNVYNTWRLAVSHKHETE